MAWMRVEEPLQFDMVEWCWRGGIDIGGGSSKVLPHMVRVDSGIYYPEDDPSHREADMSVSTCDRLPIFTDEAFDCVFSSYLLDCTENPLETLKEWWRLVRIDRPLVLHLAHTNVGPMSRPTKKHALTPEGVLGMMEQIGGDWDLRVKALRNDNNFASHGREKFEGDDVRESMVGAVSVRLKDPVFESQTKNKLGNTEIRTDLVNRVREELLQFFNRNKEIAEKIIAKVQDTRQLRKELQEVKKLARERAKAITIRIPQLKDCRVHFDITKGKGKGSMIFLTEGMSPA